MAVVEELIGRIRLTATGVKEAKDAAKVMADLRKSLKGLADVSRRTMDGPAKAARGFKAMADAARTAAQAQKSLQAGAKAQVTVTQRIAAAYKEAATASSAFHRPKGAGAGASWAQRELKHLKAYKKTIEEIGVEEKAAVKRRRLRGREREKPIRFGAEPLRDSQDPPSRRGWRGRRGGDLGGEVYSERPSRLDGMKDRAKGYAQQGFDEAATTPQIKALLRSRTINEKDPARIAANEAQIEQAVSLSKNLTRKTPEFSQSQHLQGIYQTMGTVGSLEKALEVYPMIAEYNAVIEGLADRFERLKPYAGGASTKDFARIFDTLGRTDDKEKMRTLGDAILKGVQSSSGEVTPSDFAGAIKYMRMAKYGVSDDFLQNYLPGIMGDVKVKSGGASSAGTGLASLYDQFYNLRTTAAAKEIMERTGLTAGKFERGKKGGIVGRGTAELVQRDLFRKNPQKWMNEVMDPLIRLQMGVAGDVPNDDDSMVSAIQTMLGRLTSNRNASDTAGSMLIQREERERDARIARSMPGVEALPLMRDQSPVSALQQLTGALKDLWGALAEPGVQPALAAMKSVATAVRQFTSWQQENPAAGGAAATATVAAGGVGGAFALRALKNRFLNWWGGGGGAAAAAEGAAPAAAAGATTSAGSAIATLSRLTAAAAAPATIGMSGEDQRTLMGRLGRFAEGELAKKGQDREGIIGRERMRFDGSQIQARLTDIQDAATKTMETLNQTATPGVDTSQIDGAQAKADKLLATLKGAGGAASAVGSGIGAAALVKGSNSFTGGGATSP